MREKSTHLEVIRQVLTFAWTAGFDILALEFSPIKGPEGNIEYLAWLQKTDRPEKEEVPSWEEVRASCRRGSTGAGGGGGPQGAGLTPVPEGRRWRQTAEDDAG